MASRSRSVNGHVDELVPAAPAGDFVHDAGGEVIVFLGPAGAGGVVGPGQVEHAVVDVVFLGCHFLISLGGCDYAAEPLLVMGFE